MIILDEFSYAKNIFNNGLSSFMNGKDIRLLIMYFRNIGVEESEIYNKINNWLLERQENYNEILYQEFLLNIIKTSKKSKIKKFQNIVVTENEFNIIRNIKNYRLEKILFIMLVLSKYYFIIGKNFDENNTNYYTLKTTPYHILKFAKTNEKNKEWIFNQLLEKNIINTNFGNDGAYYIVNINKNDNSDPKIIIENFNNFIDYYKPYCEICGIEIEKTGKNKKMCEKCFKEKRKKEINENAKKYYSNKKKNFYTV